MNRQAPDTSIDTNAPSRSRSGREQRFLQRYGPYAVVTGASSGIGREIACRLAEGGFDLVLVGRREQLLRDIAADLTSKHGVHVRSLPLDLSQRAGLDELTAATAETDIGLCVAAAGFGTSGAFLDSPLETELEMLRINCAAVLTVSWLFGRRLAERGRGGLILMSSVVGFQGMPYAAHYAATKAYVQTLAEALYVELKPRGVDVLAAAPGPTRSGFAERADMQMGRALSPRDVAKATLDTLGRKPTALPGLLSRVLKDSITPLPRRVRVRIMGSVMAGMTSHQRTGTSQ